MSSSAHVAAVPWLLGWDVASWADARRKELEVALHFGALVALAPSLWRLRPDARTLALSLAPPVVLGYALERPIEERLGGPAGLAGGMLRRGRPPAALARAPTVELHNLRLWKSTLVSALALGFAQAAALWPGRVADRRDAGGGARARVLAPRRLATVVRRRRAGARGRDGAEGLARAARGEPRAARGGRGRRVRGHARRRCGSSASSGASRCGRTRPSARCWPRRSSPRAGSDPARG